jgi:hypothetical protein
LSAVASAKPGGVVPDREVREQIADVIREAEADKATDGRERVQRDVEQLLADASQRLSTDDLSGALAQVDAARRLDGSCEAALALHHSIARALEAATQRQGVEQLARERYQMVADAIGRVEEAPSHQLVVEAEAGQVDQERPVAAAVPVNPLRVPWWRSQATYTAFAAAIVLAVVAPYFATTGEIPANDATPSAEAVSQPDEPVDSRTVTPPIIQMPRLITAARQPAPAAPTRPASPAPTRSAPPLRFENRPPVTAPVPTPVATPVATTPPQPNPDVQAQEKQLQVRSILARAEGLLDTGQYADMLRLIDDALKVDPKNSEALSLRQKVEKAQAFEGSLKR